jgi:hypothetical protein
MAARRADATEEKAGRHSGNDVDFKWRLPKTTNSERRLALSAQWIAKGKEIVFVSMCSVT